MEKILIEQPDTKRELTKVKFGNIDSSRGENLMDIVELDDYYYWLRDDERKNTEILNHLKKENEYTDKIMENYKKLENELYKEILSHIKEDYDTYPFPKVKLGWDSTYYYFNRNIKNKSYPIYCRINNITKNEEILLDENKLSENKTSFDLKGFKISDDEIYMSYGVDLNGSEKYKLYIIDIKSKNELSHDIPELMYCSYFWNKSNIFYTLGDEKNRMYQIWRYDIKSKINKLIYEEKNPLIDIGISLSHDEKIYYINAGSYETDFYYYYSDEDNILPFTKKVSELKFSICKHHDNFLITTNKDNSINFKVMITNLKETSEEYWKEFIPYNKNHFIEGVTCNLNNLLIFYKEIGDYFIKVIPYLNGEYLFDKSHIINIDEDIKNISLEYLCYKSNDVVISNNTLKTPYTLFKYNLESKNIQFLRQKEIPNYIKDNYTSKRIYAKSHDCKDIPISLIYKTDLFNADSTNPVYLYGYGSYGNTVDPTFRSTILPLLDRGFIFAIGHIRGGSFLGYEWYEDGKMKNKMNTFFDFISCAKHLIDNKYTNNEGIVIEGGSAGGLLVGACMNLRPELFRTVIGNVPFVDVLNTVSDPTLPLSIQEWEQWGNPNQKEYFDYIKQYSPYDNIKDDIYPNVFFKGGLNDPRVPYWEPAKFISKLRYHNKNKNNIILLKTEMEQGHFGGMDRYKYIKELAFEYSFIFKTFDLLE